MSKLFRLAIHTHTDTYSLKSRPKTDIKTKEKRKIKT